MQVNSRDLEDVGPSSRESSMRDGKPAPVSVDETGESPLADPQDLSDEELTTDFLV